MNQTRSVAGCQSDMETVRQIAFYDSRSDDRQGKDDIILKAI